MRGARHPRENPRFSRVRCPLTPNPSPPAKPGGEGRTANFLARRWFFKECGVGLGTIALHALLHDRGAAFPGGAERPADPMMPRQPHFPARAKNVIYLFMAGGPSHLELFDNKPALSRYDGTRPPAELLQGYRSAFIRPEATFLGPKFRFARHGKCGAELSEVLPNLGELRRRHRDREVDGDRRLQPCPRPDPHEHGRSTVRPAEPRLMVALRPRERVARSSRVRRLQLRQEGPERRRVELGERLSSDRVQRRPLPLRRRSGSLSLQSARHRSAGPARFAGCST